MVTLFEGILSKLSQSQHFQRCYCSIKYNLDETGTLDRNRMTEEIKTERPKIYD